MSLCAAADYSAPDPLVTASLSAASWHQPPAGRRERQAQAFEFKTLPIAATPACFAGRGPWRAPLLGYLNIGIAQVSTEQGKLHLFVAIDRTSILAFVQLHEKSSQRIAAAFLHGLVAAVSYTIHTVLTDNVIRVPRQQTVDEATEAKAEAYWSTQDRPRRQPGACR